MDGDVFCVAHAAHHQGQQYIAAPVDGKVKKRKPKRKPVVVKVEQQKQIQEEVIDAFSDSLAADALALLGDTLTNDTLPWPESLRARLDTIIMKSRTVKTSQFAVMIYDLTADSLLYAVNEKQTLRPASTMKLLTAIAALAESAAAVLIIILVNVTPVFPLYFSTSGRSSGR